MHTRVAEPRVAILVLGCLLPVYDRCIRIIRATWGAPAYQNVGVDTFYVYGGLASRNPTVVAIEQLIGGPRPTLRNDDVWCAGDVILCGAGDLREDQDDGILRKRLLAFGYLANQRGYDYIYTVCACSYIDIDALRRYVAGLPRAGVYHGSLSVDQDSGYPFVSGASILLSRDLAAALADNHDAITSTYPVHLADDVVIGHFIATHHSRTSAAEIARSIAEGRKPTDDETFVMPAGGDSIDFVDEPAYGQIPRGVAYHFHFNSRRMWDMENFHRRFFAGRARGKAAQESLRS